MGLRASTTSTQMCAALKSLRKLVEANRETICTPQHQTELRAVCFLKQMGIPTHKQKKKKKKRRKQKRTGSRSSRRTFANIKYTHEIEHTNICILAYIFT